MENLSNNNNRSIRVIVSETKQSNIDCFMPRNRVINSNSQKWLLLFILNFCCIVAKAQKWSSIGTTWNYTKLEAFTAATGPSEWKVVDTMTIKGKLCSVTQLKHTLFDTNSRRNLTMLTYEDSDVVYWYRPELHDFTVLYDFNKAVGEYWDIKGLRSGIATIDTGLCTLRMTVTKIGFDTINGIPLKTMWVISDHITKNFSGKIIQYIGSLSNIRPNPDYCCKPISETWEFGLLRCFESDSIGFHDFKIVPDCDYTLTSIKELPNEPIVSCSPNPFTYLLTLSSLQSGVITVFNVLGQVVFNSEVQENAPLQINAINWNSGIYWYRIRLPNQAISYGKLIKE